jgi:hypothetical protein
MAWNRNYYGATIAVIVAESLLWLYSFRYIGAHSNPLGDGMEWLAAVPLTAVFVALVVPAAISALLGWWFVWAAKLAAGLAALAVVVDVVLWIEIIGEFNGKPAH